MGRLHFCCVLACLSLALGCSDTEPPPTGATAEMAETGQALYADLMVNGSPAPQLTRDLPVILTAALQNSDPERRARLKGIVGIKPKLRAADSDRDVDLEWTAPAMERMELPPNASAWATWILHGELPLGVYRISLEGTSELAVDEQGNPFRVRAEPLRLEVVEGSAEPAQLAALQRRRLALLGDKAGYLAAVRQALERDPDSHPLCFELVQALDMNGQPAEAGWELASLIARAEARFKQEHPEQTLHLPSWYYTYQRELEQRGTGSTGATPDR